jgi:hypothetical protein
MAEEVLARQAKATVIIQTGQSFESALEAVSSTEAGQQLREMANGEHRLEKAQDWQASVLWGRTEGRLVDLGIASDTISRFATTTLGPCQVGSKTEHPCPHRAPMPPSGGNGDLEHPLLRAVCP